MKIFILLGYVLIFQFLLAQDLPPLPEVWELAINDIIQGVKKDNWLSDYRFLAKPRVNPGKNWKVRIEATWTGPSLLDPALLNYLSLVFDPLDRDFFKYWSGTSTLSVRRYNHTTKRIVFTPKYPASFMKASTSRLGVYNGMQFSLKVGDEVLPGMNVLINTRVSRDVEVTCSDGIYCNGDERYVKVGKTFKCMKAKFGPCDDPAGDPCQSYECIESERECNPYPLGGSLCRSCNSTNDNSAELCRQQNYECGWNSDRTLYCGTCTDTSLACSKNKCIPKSTLGEGSCNKPYQLYEKSLVIPPEGLPEFSIIGDLSSSKYIDHVIPKCNPSPVPDVVYEFKIESQVPMGIEVQMLSSDGTTDSMDTVLALTNETCDPLGLYSYCGDDSSPPGGVSSRIFGKLDNGTYKLVATAFSDSPANIREYELRIKFYPNCLPQCEGNRQCGSDGCGGICGNCSNGESCHEESGSCRANPCIRKCSSMTKENLTEIRECGSDGCGGICGSCNVLKSEMCVFESGKCIQVKLCDNKLPVCLGNPPKRMPNPYCGHDCRWHDLSERLGDLIPNNKSLVLPSVEFNWVKVENRSCAIVEGCHKERGNRLLMRFDTFVHNTGRDIFYPPSAASSPHLFEYSPCHAHFHFDGFALFTLYDLNSVIVGKGGKRGYCMEDTIQTMFGNHIPCKNKYDCTNQGIQIGWADLYPNVLDCQWIDITDIPKEKWYIYEICSNVDRKLHEASNTNDCKRFQVYIPVVPFSLEATPLKYADVLNQRNISQQSAPSIDLEPGTIL